MTSSIDKLIAGFGQFRHRYYEEDPQLFRELTTRGQKPTVLMIACSDSRVTPSVTFDSGPGEIFMVRNVANLVPPSEADGHLHGTSAAIEFAVEKLEVEHIIVNGHSQCGGIEALWSGLRGNFIGPWVDIAREAREEVMKKYGDASPEEQRAALEKAAMLVSLENLLTFPSVRRRVVRGDLKLHGWYFDLEEGRLYGYEPLARRFAPLA